MKIPEGEQNMTSWLSSQFFINIHGYLFLFIIGQKILDFAQLNEMQ